tara:strand:+ start:926 stop:1180 length:255 start_codon:yes stop_codon:yes gene_type:complete
MFFIGFALTIFVLVIIISWCSQDNGQDEENRLKGFKNWEIQHKKIQKINQDTKVNKEIINYLILIGLPIVLCLLFLYMFLKEVL